MTALPPVFPASLVLELLAARVVPVSFDRSAVVEGMVCPTAASSPDAVVRGILAAGLQSKNFKFKSSKSKMKVLDCTRLVTYLSLVAWEELLCFLTTDHAPFGCLAWVSARYDQDCAPRHSSL